MIQLRKSKGLLKNDVTKIGGGGYPKLVTKSEIGGTELGGAGGVHANSDITTKKHE